MIAENLFLSFWSVSMLSVADRVRRGAWPSGGESSWRSFHTEPVEASLVTESRSPLSHGGEPTKQNQITLYVHASQEELNGIFLTIIVSTSADEKQDTEMSVKFVT